MKSATKPQRIDSFDNLDVLDMAAGQNTTFWIIRPPPSISPAALSPVPTPAVVAPAPLPVGGVDLSGFGFNFAPAAPAPVAPVVTESEEDEGERRTRVNASKTDQGQWEEMGRYPVVLDGVDQCQICGEVEGAEEALECEMVSLPFPPFFCGWTFGGGWDPDVGIDSASRRTTELASRRLSPAFPMVSPLPPFLSGMIFLLLLPFGLRSSSSRRMVLPKLLTRDGRAWGGSSLSRQETQGAPHGEEGCAGVDSSSVLHR